TLRRKWPVVTPPTHMHHPNRLDSQSSSDRPAMQTLITRPRTPVAPLLAVACMVLLPLLTPPARGAEPPAAAQKLIDQAVKAMRVDPDASKRFADQALAILAKDP